MKRVLLGLIVTPLILSSCGGGKKEEPKEGSTIYIVNHPDDVGKNGKGVYLNSNSERTCPHCGMRVHRDNIFHDCQNTKNISGASSGSSSGNGNGNQYGKGYEQGQEDAANGLEPNPSGYGGNGQFEKGYEDGYEDY